MSRAEDRARDSGYGTDPFNRAEYTANEVRGAFIEGYQQAEKDLELTIEDIKTIGKLLNQCVDYSNPYQEILKRFRERKEK